MHCVSVVTVVKPNMNPTVVNTTSRSRLYLRKSTPLLGEVVVSKTFCTVVSQPSSFICICRTYIVVKFVSTRLRDYRQLVVTLYTGDFGFPHIHTLSEASDYAYYGIIYSPIEVLGSFPFSRNPRSVSWIHKAVRSRMYTHIVTASPNET